MSDKQKSFIDNEMYRTLSVPFESVEAAQAALIAFAEGMYELRIKHKIRNVYAVCDVTAKDADGDEGDSTVVFHYGDSLRRLPMTAYAFGIETAEHEQAMKDQMNRGKRAKLKHQ